MIWPSSTITVDSTARLLVMMPAAFDWSCTLDTSWKICSLTAPPSEICGLMRKVRPTSRRSIVWNGVAVVALPVCAYCPVMKGTFWPITIFASSLSSVSRLGVDRMFAFVSDARKRASAPRLTMVPTPGSVICPLTTPMLMPGPTFAGLIDASMILVPLPRVPKFVPPNNRLRSDDSSLIDCHWMPNSAALSAVSSTMSAST